MNDDLERLISDSLAQRDAAAAPSGAGIDAVYERVGQRRVRRRAVAAVGSVALVAVGVAAVAAVGGDDGLTPTDSPEAASLDGALGGEWAEHLPAGTPVWQCSGQVVYHDADGNSYWADCTPVTLPEDAGVISAYDVVVDTTISYVGDCFVTTTAPGGPDARWAPCEVVPATTAPLPCEFATTTTTIVPADMTSAPDVTWAGTLVCVDHLPVPTTTTISPDDIATTTTSIACIREADSTTTTLPCRIEEHGAMVALNEQIYVIVAFDSPASVADRFGISVQQLFDYNGWDPTGARFNIGDEILIPPGAVIPAD